MPRDPTHQLGEWTVDLARCALVGRDEVRRLTTREAALLGYLLAHPREDLSREALLAEVWGYAPTALTRAVDHTMRRLRAKLGDDPDAPRHLITVHGVGYRLEPATEHGATPVTAPARPSRVLRLGADAVDMDRQILEGPDGRTAQLTSQEVRILDVLATRMPEPVERDDLFRLVWGLRSTGPSRAVDHAMTRLRKKIERDPQAPVHLKGVRGSGYVLEGVISTTTLVSAVAPGIDPSAFVGRDADLARLHERVVRGASILTLVGTGGMGKTRLAQELTRRFTDRAMFFCDLAAAEDLWAFLSAVGAALDLSLEAKATTDAAAATIAQALLAHAHPLLVLDNFEQLPEEAALVVGGWATALPHALFLVTSRTPLKLARELVHEVGPLSPDAALAMFVDRVEQKGGAVKRDDPHLARVLEQLAGYPLAIELAATRAVKVGTKALAQGLVDLESESKDSLERHRSLRSCFLWSWSRLTDREQEVLVQATQFRGGFTRPTAEAVFGSDVTVLERLLDHHLVVLKDSADQPEEPRYDLFVILRELVETMGHPTWMQASEAHARWAAQLGFPLAQTLRLEHDATALDSLRAERANLEAALARTTTPGLRARLAVTLVQSDVAERVARAPADMLDRAIADGAAAADPRVLAHALDLRARRAIAAGRLDEAEADLSRAFACGWGEDEAHLLRTKGMLVTARGDLDDAMAAYEEAFRRSEGRTDHLAALANDIGLVWHRRRDLQQARLWYDRAVDEARRHGHDHRWAVAAGNRGLVARDENQLALGETWLRRAAAVSARIHRGRVSAAIAGGLAGVLLDLGQAEEALEWARRERFESVAGGSVHGVLYGTMHTIIATLLLGRLDEAETELEIAEENASPTWTQNYAFSELRGMHAWLSGDLARAVSWFVTAEAEAAANVEASRSLAALRGAAEDRLGQSRGRARIRTALEQVGAGSSPKHRSELGRLAELMQMEVPFDFDSVEGAFERLVERMLSPVDGGAN